MFKSRGAKASVAPGGDGFECPASGCKSVFDTAEEALEHGATHGLSGAREVDDEGKSCCLWQGCAKPVKVARPSTPLGIRNRQTRAPRKTQNLKV